MVEHAQVQQLFQTLRPVLDERMRRLVAAGVAQVLGRGGVTVVASATGLARSTIARGHSDLAMASPAPQVRRVRLPGGGRTPRT